LLALLAAAIGSMCRRPAIKHSLWLLVLLKLITPPIVGIPVPWLADLYAAAAPASTWAIPETPPAALDTALPRWDFDVADKAGVVADEAPSTDLAETERTPQTEPELLRATEEESQIPAPTLDRAEPVALDEPALPWPWIITVVWLAGSACWFALTTIRIDRFQRSLSYATPAPASITMQVRELAKRLGLVSCPAIWLVPGRISPLVWTLGGKKRLFIPTALWERLNKEQRATLLAHELAHLRRRDHWVRGLELAVTGLYWWHPVVWWACRELRDAEEQCCDAWVVWAFPQSARAYATALVETVDFLSESEVAVPAVASGFGHVHDLRRRLTMIMRGTTPRALSSVGLLAVLGLAAFLLPMLPTQAQPPPPAASDSRVVEQERRAAEKAEERANRFRDLEDRGVLQRRERETASAPVSDDPDHEAQGLSRQINQMQEQIRAATMRLRQVQEDAQARQRERAARDNEQERVARGSTQERSPTRSSGSDQDRRLRDVERKLDTVLEELRALRREIRQPRRGNTGGGAGGGLAGGLAPPGAPTLAPPAIPTDPSLPAPPGIAATPSPAADPLATPPLPPAPRGPRGGLRPPETVDPSISPAVPPARRLSPPRAPLPPLPRTPDDDDGN